MQVIEMQSSMRADAAEWQPGQPSRADTTQRMQSSLCADAAEWRPGQPPRADLCASAPEWTPASPLATRCHFFAQGKCLKGAACPFTHDNVEASEPAPPRRAPCRFFAQGACRKGTECPFSHDVMSIPHAADESTTSILEGARCTFGLGLKVQKLVFSDGGSTRVAINGLAASITDADITAVLSKLGPVRVFRKHETYAFAQFDTADLASAAVSNLNATPFDRWHRTIQKGSRHLDSCVTLSLISTPGQVVTKNASVKVLWYAASRVGWAHFGKRGAAQAGARLANGKILHGRAVTMSYQQPSRNQTTSFSVWMGGIGEGVSERDISRFLQQHGGTAPDSVTLGPLPFSEKRAGKIVEGLLTSIGPLASYEEAPRPRAALKCKALAKFARASDAQEACRHLDSQKTSALGGGKLFLSRVFSAKFVLLNPVYAVVRSQMTPLLDLLASADHGLVRHKTFPSDASTTISLQADTPVAIAFAKGMLSPIFNGECISLAEGEGALWHVRFSYPEVETELQQLNTVLAGGALVIRDTRRRELRVWGEEALRRTAIAAVRKLLQGFTNHQSVLPLPPEEFVIFLRLGLLDELKAACSAHSASLNLNTRSVLIEGDAQVVQRAIVFLAARLSENAGAAAHETEAESHLCSVCYCPPDEPVKLSCAHEYCGSCLRDWMKATSSAGGGPGFPIECLAEGCKQLVSIADLSKALSNEDLHALRRAALDEHVNANLDRLQFCISAGCGGIFPLNDARTSHCSACRLCICTSCKVEEHEGLTCQQYLQAKAPPDRLRMRVIEEILTLQCPRCGQAFLDFEGCFALKCSKCPCGFCGWCLADCGSDAHAHVRTCTAKPAGADIFFGSHTQFVEAQRKRQALKLREFLANLPAAERDGLMQSLATDLRDLGLQL